MWSRPPVVCLPANTRAGYSPAEHVNGPAAGPNRIRMAGQAAPTMTVAHLIFALATTAYILIAIRLEERDLVSAFGNVYVDYRARTPMLIPRLWSRPSDRVQRETV